MDHSSSNLEMDLERRDQLSIIIELMGMLTSPMRITRLVRCMRLNHVYLKKYLKRIDELGLLEHNGAEYSLSPKGKEFYKLLKN